MELTSLAADEKKKKEKEKNKNVWHRIWNNKAFKNVNLFYFLFSRIKIKMFFRITERSIIERNDCVIK